MHLDNEGNTHEMMFLGGACPVLRKEVFDLLYPDGLAELANDRPGLLIGAMAADNITGLTLLRVYKVTRDLVNQFETQTAVRIEARDEIILPPPASLTAAVDGAYADGTITGEVLAISSAAIALGVSKATLKAFKVGRVTEMMLTIGDWQTRALYLAPGEHDFRPYHIVNAGSRKSDDLASSIRQYMSDGGDAMFRTILGEKRAEAICRLLAELKAKSTFIPDKGLVPNDPTEGERIRAAYLGTWIEGLERWQSKEVAIAVPGPHWDALDRQVLICRPIHHPAHFTCAAAAGAPFTLVHAGP
jgi:hypothetical protein